MKTFSKAFIFLSLLVLMFLYVKEAKAENVSVGAQIEDLGNPNPPILISPGNGSFLSNTKPTFTFQLATDPQSPIRHYEMYLNGSLFIKELPSSQTPVETNQYTSIIYNSQLSFTLKQALADGVYTWKIKAFDMYGHEASSATWTFTIDNVSPFIIITKVGENENLNLSSQDPDSIPLNLTLETKNLKPDFQGITEPGASIKITLIPLDNNNGLASLTGSANTQGIFNIIPGQNLLAGTYQVLIIASDAAGNTVTLPEFFLKVSKPTASPIIDITIPPPLAKEPADLIQLPQATSESIISPGLLINLLPLLFLLLWLGFSKLGFSLTWTALTPFFFLNLLPPVLRKKKSCLCYNATLKQSWSFTTISLNQDETSKTLLSDKKGGFNLSLKPGNWLIWVKQKELQLFKDKIIIKSKDKTNVYLCLPLKLNLYTWKQQSLQRKLAAVFLLLALTTSILLLLFNPNLIILIIFLICLDLTISFLL